MLASLPFAWKYLLPEQLVDFSKSLVFSLFFSSNFYWDISLQAYGAESALLQPFLHTWSLAVEEQYYIVFPLLLFSIYKRGRQYLALTLSCLFVSSLLYAQWMTGRDASFAFYMMPTRFWELLAGSLLALLALKERSRRSSARWHKAMPALGLTLILVSLIAFDYDVHHPGFVTLVPVIGTVLIIHYMGESNWVTRGLSSPVMVYLGLLSYSLYLWHYPIFAFGRMAELSPSLAHKSVWIALTLILSMLSYHSIEKPFRSRNVSRKMLVSTLFVASSVVVCVSLFWIRGNGIPDRGNYLEGLLLANGKSEASQDGIDCHSIKARPKLSDACHFNYAPGSPTLVLVGDSHAGHLSESVRVLAEANRLNFLQITQLGCPHLNAGDYMIICRARGLALRKFLKQIESPIIIYSARLPMYLTREPFDNEEESTDRYLKAVEKERMADLYPEISPDVVVDTLSSWVEDGYPLVIVYPVPEQGFHTRTLLKTQYPLVSTADQMPTLSTSYKLFKERVADSYAALDKVTGPHVSRVYPEHIFCRAATGRCIASESDRLYFSSDNHVGALGSDLVVREIAKQLELKAPASFRK
jgi:peptidoglycan/LPS O-acetylase OafA/YrhL